MKAGLTQLGSGLLMGTVLSRIGFSSWDEVHRMFVFADLRLLLTFGCAVAVLGGFWLTLRVRTRQAERWSRRHTHPGSLVGGVLFGAGWALCGACPSIAIVQIGEGQLLALATLSGIFVGNYAYAVIHARYFRWAVTSCAGE